MKFYNNLRTKKEDQPYINNILQQFSDLFSEKTIKCVDYGKQDTRGSFSITITYLNGGCSGVKYFKSVGELIAYIEGVLDYKSVSGD
jgi:hypothetical protein